MTVAFELAAWFVLDVLSLVLVVALWARVNVGIRIIERDRAEIAELRSLLQALHALVVIGGDTGLRLEAAARMVAADLAESHDRADDAAGGVAGEAADAASRSAP